jgi:hypothetical protein
MRSTSHEPQLGLVHGGLVTMAGLKAQWSSANNRSGHWEGNALAWGDGGKAGEAHHGWRWVVQL